MIMIIMMMIMMMMMICRCAYHTIRSTMISSVGLLVSSTIANVISYEVIIGGCIYI